MAPGIQIQPIRATILLWSSTLQGLAAAPSPRCKAPSPTTPLEGGCFVSAFSPCLAPPRRPGPRVSGWGRGQGEGTRQEHSPGSQQAPGKRKHTRGHCCGDHGELTQGRTAAWVRSCSGHSQGRTELPAPFPPARGRQSEPSSLPRGPSHPPPAGHAVRTSTT